jgi:hypothetical protein
MDSNKEKQEISIIGRLFSMEVLLIVMGLLSLIAGIVRKDVMPVFWGVMIIGGSIVLHFVRKKDWKKHWEEQEAERQFYEELARAKKEREKKKEQKKEQKKEKKREKGDGGK